MIRYEFREGPVSFYKDRVDAQACGKFIHDLSRTPNGSQSEVILNAAANPDNPLHNGLEWDNAKCGHAHRLDQIRSLTSSLRIVPAVITDTPQRAFLSIRPSGGP